MTIQVTDTLFQNNNICNHHRNIQALMAEIYKIKNNLNPPITDFKFERRKHTRNLWNSQESATEKKKHLEKWVFKLQTTDLHNYGQLCLKTLNKITFLHFFVAFQLKLCFSHFHFFFFESVKFPQQNINQSETGIGDK